MLNLSTSALSHVTFVMHISWLFSMMTWQWRDVIPCTMILIFSVSDEIKSQSISGLNEQDINLCLLLCGETLLIKRF